jgi:hypothetical protein
VKDVFQRLAVFGLIVALSGCHVRISQDHLAMPEDRFRSLWTVYRHCLDSSDPDATRVDSDWLRRAVELAWDNALALPTPVWLIAKLPVRLSVDPNAMSAACTLHAAHTALAEGRPSAAVQLFHSVMSLYLDDEYSYYVAQARTGLTRLASLADASFNLRLVSVP